MILDFGLVHLKCVELKGCEQKVDVRVNRFFFGYD